MTGRLTTLEGRISQWARAYEVVRREITPDTMRETLAVMQEVNGVTELSSYMTLAANVMSNDRVSAQVAATLVVNGVRPDEDE